MFKSNLILRMAEPILSRIGTALAGTLVGVGLAAEQGPSVQSLTVALGLLGVDLVSRRFLKGK